MEEYLQHMKTLRTQMNDVEDQAAKISVDEQMQITTIHTLENDLNSAKSELKRVLEVNGELVKSKAEIRSRILEKQKRIASLESDSFNLSQTLELVQKERSNYSAKVQEKRVYYSKVIEDMCSKVQEKKDWIYDRLLNKPLGESSMQVDSTQEVTSQQGPVQCSLGDGDKELMLGKLQAAQSSQGPVRCSLGDGDKELMLGKLQAAQSKLDEIICAKNKLVSENSELARSIEQLKSDINNLKPELSTTEVTALEEERKVLLSEKNGEMEFMQSLQSQLEKLKGISHDIKCACGEEYKVEMGLFDVAE